MNEEEIKGTIAKLVERIEFLEQKVANAVRSSAGEAGMGLQTLLAELKRHGIHSSLYIAPPEPGEEFVYGAEGQAGAWTETEGEGKSYPGDSAAA